MYWLVSEDHKGPIALVRCTTIAKTIAGNPKALKGFKGCQPYLLISEPWYFELISSHSWWPAIGELVRQLGPVKSPASKLKKSREYQKRQKLAQERKVRAERLTDSVKEEIDELLCRGVGVDHIKQKYGLSPAFIKSLNTNLPV